MRDFNETINTIVHVLRTQPDIQFSIFDVIIDILICVLGTYINWKYLKDMKSDHRQREAGTKGKLIKDVMTTYTNILMVTVPTFMFINTLQWLLKREVGILLCVERFFCFSIVQYILYAVRIYIAFNSLVVATMRYTFIVHHDYILRFGKEKAKSFFYWGSILVPNALAILMLSTLPPGDFILSFPASSICINSYWESIGNKSFVETNYDSFNQNVWVPISYLVQPHIEGELTYYLGWFARILMAIVWSNLTEAFLYWGSFANIKR